MSEVADKYPCTACGECCKRIGANVAHLPKDIFPYKVREDGSCEMLMANNMCQVYDSRPVICQVDKMFEIHHQFDMTQEEFYQETMEQCNTWMAEAGLPAEKFVTLKTN